MKMWNWLKMIGLSTAIAYLFTMTQLMWGLVNGYTWTISPDWANGAEFILAVLGLAVLASEVINHIRNWRK